MEHHYLRPLFDPTTISVYAGAATGTSAGCGDHAAGLKAALADAVFRGTVTHWLRAADGSLSVRASATSRLLSTPAELALITLEGVAAIAALEHAADRGARAAIVYDAQMSAEIAQQLKARAKALSICLLGPASLGIQRPHLGLNACLAGKLPRTGTLAMVSQSGALTASMLDWADSNGVSFSLVASLGRDSALYFADVLDFMAADVRTQNIVLYLESIPENGARRFMSALRAAARNKPVIVLKAGRYEAGKRAAITHSGAMVGGDDVFDAALRRAGAVRVDSLVNLFAAAKCLTSRQKPVGNRLAIITNGGGPGVLAADRATVIGVALAVLSAASIEALRRKLPKLTAVDGPLDLGEDAGALDYLAAVEIVAADPGVDGLLIIVTPKPGVDATTLAEAAIKRLPTLGKPVLTCWMGEPRMIALRRAIVESGLPLFRLPEAAVDAFASVALFYRNQQASMQTPPPLMAATAGGADDRDSSPAISPDLAAARALIATVLAQGRELLTETESKALLTAFRIPVAATLVAETEDAAVEIAERIAYPVVLKISSPDVAHKTDVGGVLLNVRSADQVRAGFRVLCDAVRQRLPDARIDGVAIQPMVSKRNGREWYVGMTTDALFGPVITLGVGGVMIELLNDRTVALPPLNQFLAQRLIERSPLVAQLGAWRGMPPVKMAALEYLLMRVSEMICELPTLRELDINPVIIDEDGVAVVDASAVVRLPVSGSGRRYGHMAILPYPSYLTTSLQLKTGESLTLRAIRPEDADALQSFVRKLSPEARYFRFISTMAELPLPMLARFTQIDYYREMAIVAIADADAAADASMPAPRLVGVARYMLLPDGESCEYGLAVADDFQRLGLGTALMNRLADIAREQGLKTMVGMVLNHNNGMLRLMARLGFTIDADPDDADMRRVLRAL